jgi:predicted metal-binding membrane protein
LPEKTVSRPIEKQIRSALIAVVVALTISAWALTYYQTRNMGMLMQFGVPMSLGMEGHADLVSLAVFTGMWCVMMVAMMLPSTYPTLLFYRTISRSRCRKPAAATAIFATSYFLTWTATGLLFYGTYVMAGAVRTSIPDADSAVLRGAALCLILSGIYQWSPFKRACLTHCQNPFDFVSEHWHDGFLGAARMGFHHGLYCFGCCWGLMLVLTIMGIMHLGWMAAIGAVILLEKLLPGQNWIPRASGALFILAGMGVFIFPQLLAQFSSQVLLGR